MVDNTDLYDLLELATKGDTMGAQALTDIKKVKHFPFIPDEYIKEIEREFLQSGEVMAYSKNGTKRLVMRGERLDWSTHFYERLFPRVKEAVKNVALDKKGIPSSSIKCYIKD